MTITLMAIKIDCMMKFYDRKKEFELLQDINNQSRSSACFTVMVGRRRIGKTSLLLKSMQHEKFLYLFVSRKNEILLCQQFQQDIKESLNLEIFGKVDNFRTLFEQLMIYATKTHFTLIIDEFQEFDNVNSSIFSDIQHIWDKYKEQAKINFIACGSIYSMMKKIFENNKEPLFGRLTSKIILKPFNVSTIKEILKDYNPKYTPEDLLAFYLITGGVAKYVTLLMEAGAITFHKMIRYTVRPDSPLLSEGRDLLISEFGREYATYFSILQLIASGKTAQTEIDSIIGKNTGAYLANLEKEYSLINRNKPMFSKPEGRNNRWCLNDNYLMFWFRFIFPNLSMIELGKNEMLEKYILKNYEQYSGLILERYFRDKIAESEDITDIGNYWDNKGENEIDLIALNRFENKALIAEIKRNPQKINIARLYEKTATLKKQLSHYTLDVKGLSMTDM